MIAKCTRRTQQLGECCMTIVRTITNTIPRNRLHRDALLPLNNIPIVLKFLAIMILSTVHANWNTKPFLAPEKNFLPSRPMASEKCLQKSPAENS